MIRTSISDVVFLLRALGLGEGDKVFVHLFLPSLGIVEHGLAGLQRAFAEILGPTGALIVPTFTASYRRGEIYDVRESRSFNGAFSEHVRGLDGAVRSLDPLFSFAAIGSGAADLLRRDAKNCFGEGSVYDRLFRAEVKFLTLGVHWDQGLSFMMHLEKLAGVPYRQDQTFEGITRDRDGRTFADSAIHFVRHDAVKWKRNRGPLGERLVADGVGREILHHGQAYRLFPAGPLVEAVLSALRQDPWCMTTRDQ
jgi:aminoglycoside 3-N-acetyltransferase